MKPVIVREISEPRKAWVCPHCDQEILEKHMHKNASGNMMHTDCQGEIELPGETPEQHARLATFREMFGLDDNYRPITARCGECEGGDEVNMGTWTADKSQKPHRSMGLNLSDEEMEENKAKIDKAKQDEESEQDIEEISDDPDGIEGFFNIGDHLSRLMKMLESGSFGSGFLTKMVKRMLEPHVMGHMPLGDAVLDDGDVDELGKFRGKIIIMTGGPEKSEKRVIKIASDATADLSAVTERVLAKIADMHLAAEDMKKFSSKSPIEYARNVRKAFAIAQTCRDRGVLPEDVAKILDLIDPTRYAAAMDKQVLRTASDVISDISWYTDAPGFWDSVAERLKTAYRRLADEERGMIRSAYFMTQGPSVPSQGTNNCPRFKTQKARDLEVPVEWTYCREQCIEGKPEDDGSVTCKYAVWLDKVADSHDKVMETLDVYRNPANDDMKMRIPDNKRSNPERPVLKSLEKRLQESSARTGTPWNEDGKDGEGRQLRNVTVETLMGEILDGKSGERTGEGHRETTETKLRDASGEAQKGNISERRLDSRRKQYKSSSAEGEERITEAKLDDLRDLYEMPTDKLFDELLERVSPRTDSKKPAED